MKKIIVMFLGGLLVASVLYLLYRSFLMEPEIKSPLPKNKGVEVILLTPKKTK